ncbi:hypothetical protein G5V57_01440 [Nordella sp. HKS 07]|uniref:hypothetical protein n=1 Tax=Nordella sp. HKS 07 TaxID=2712222 RepID=UPI0013E1FF43|nr:hypothetical protein [Nordella sp. HKS 07]QIG46538.1 hypothetical protein G5V57_01440 [Nordella sp. HKS 07]
MADHVLSRHAKAAAILAYGSCLRGVGTDESLIDLYVLLERDEDVSTNVLSRLGARLMPPNVYYAETLHEGRTLRCKYAVVTLSVFAARMRPETTNPYFWARFAQPSALLHASTDVNRAHVIAAVTQAVITMYRAAIATAPRDSTPADTWRSGFEETYLTELRPESGGRAGELVAANASFYDAVAQMIGHPDVPPVSWSKRRWEGKALSVARLLKAAFTFEGGASYAAWKIERHSGKKIVLSPWQRRHPVLAGFLLLPRLLWRGAIK